MNMLKDQTLVDIVLNPMSDLIGNVIHSAQYGLYD
jgi:hypothetical protein